VIKEAFEAVKIRRSSVVKAAYNPRIISDDAKERLRKKLKGDGLVMPLVWNERTSCLVGGHQRIALMDEENGYPGHDYELTVAKINVDKRKEKELNVFLNNVSAMGDWDIPALQELIHDEGFKIDDLGFNSFDADIILGETEIFSDSRESQEAKRQLDAIKEERAQADRKFVDDNSADFYTVVVFPSHEEKRKFMKAINAPEWETYADGIRALTFLQTDQYDQVETRHQ